MYPFSNNGYQTPIPYDNPTQSSNSEINPNPQSEDYFHNTYSPSIFYTDEVNEQTWLQLQDIFKMKSVTIDDKTSSKVEDTKRASSNELRNETKTKSRSKKDRHSKISTAHGLRDRRMRLSLGIARKFFDLQDSLGFDKASKTVDWLLTNSNTAIIKEIESGSKHNTYNDGIIPENIQETTTNKNQKPKENENKKAQFKKLEKKAKVHQISKESRKIARERARRRTIEKRKNDESKVLFFEGIKDCDYTGLESQCEADQDQELLLDIDDSLLWNSSADCFYQ